MRRRPTARLATVVGAATLLASLTACSSLGGKNEPEPSGPTSAGQGGGIVRTNNTEPAAGMIPSNATENGSGKVLSSLFAQLVHYDDRGRAELDVAKSIETNPAGDTVTVTLQDDRKFSDGTPVTASSFVDAWNWAANPENEQAFAASFELIEGFDEVNPPEEGAKPTATTMKGLKVLDDRTFTISLTQPSASFVDQLGGMPFAPLPKVFFDDPKAFDKKPVGNGPYAFESWTPNDVIKVRRNEHYKGGYKAQNAGVEFKVYATQEAAYADLLADNLDVLDGIPLDAISTFRDDLGERAIIQPGGALSAVAFPLYTEGEPWADPERGALLRRAFSMAVDRTTIVAALLSNTAVPATDFSAPVVLGHSRDVCGEACEFHPDKAKVLLDEAGGFDGTFTIAYNTDGGSKPYIDAVCTSIAQTLDVKCKGKPYPDFKSLLDDQLGGTMTGGYRLTWNMGFPSVADFLVPLFGTEASANTNAYSNPEFDKLVKAGLEASSDEAAVSKFTEAQEILAQDMPVIPLWYPSTTAAYSHNVENVAYDVFGIPVLSDVRVITPGDA